MPTDPTLTDEDRQQLTGAWLDVLWHVESLPRHEARRLIAALRASRTGIDELLAAVAAERKESTRLDAALRASREEVERLQLCLEPGKASAIVHAMFDHAERLGHSPVSSKHALTYLVEEVERLRQSLVFAERVITDEWGETGPSGARPQWDELRNALDRAGS